MEPKEQLHNLKSLVGEFILAGKASGYRAGTLEFYQNRLGLLLRFARETGVECLEEITPAFINQYLLWMTDTGHTQGGKFGAFRTLKTLVNWYIRTYEPVGYKNPISKVRPPSKPKILLDPIPLDDIRKLLAACPPTFTGIRDRAMIYFLLDTGVRAAELLALTVADIDVAEGKAVIRHGKGDKRRVVFFGSKCKRYLKRYLIVRRNEYDYIWQTTTGERITYWTLKDMLENRAEQAGVKRPAIHAFRRTFALEALRAGMNPFTLQRLMGHSSLDVTRVYLNLSVDDLRDDFIRASPGDKL